eukprot:UN15299
MELMAVFFFNMLFSGVLVPFNLIQSLVVRGIRYISMYWWLLQCTISVVHFDLPSDFEYGCEKSEDCLFDNLPDFAHHITADEHNSCHEFVFIHVSVLIVCSLLAYYSLRRPFSIIQQNT